MKTSMMMAALIAAGFGMQAAVAQNVHSDQDKARAEEQSMQQKEQGAKGNATSDQSAGQRANSAAGRSDSTGNSNATTDNSNTTTGSSNATADRNDKAPGAGRTKDDMKAQDQSKADDEMARAENGQAQQGGTGNIPGQSKSSVGDPKNAKTTGEGQGVKEEGSGTANSGSATGAGAKSGSDARQ